MVLARFPFERVLGFTRLAWFLTERSAPSLICQGLLPRFGGGFLSGYHVGGYGLPGVTLDISQLLAILRRREGYRNALGARAAGTADAMHVVFRVLRQVIINDMGDAGDVDAARGHVGRDQQTHYAR